jgi:hypothetical protein
MKKSMILAGSGVAAIALAGAGGAGYALSANSAHSPTAARAAVIPQTARQSVSASPSASQTSAGSQASQAPPSAGASSAPPVQTASPVQAAAPSQQQPQEPAAAPPEITDPWAVVSAYYGDIEAGDFSEAWSLLSSSMQDQLGPYSGWSAGYSCTSGDSVSENYESGDAVSIDIVSAQCDGSTQAYSGTYTVDNGKIVSASISGS